MRGSYDWNARTWPISRSDGLLRAGLEVRRDLDWRTCSRQPLEAGHVSHGLMVGGSVVHSSLDHPGGRDAQLVQLCLQLRPGAWVSAFLKRRSDGHRLQVALV